MKTKMTKYRCPHCKLIVSRESAKQWIESYCETTGRITRLQRVKPKAKKREAKK